MIYHLTRPKQTEKVLNIHAFWQMQELVEMCANMAFSQDFNVTRTGKTMTVSLRKLSGASGFDPTLFDFGYEITDAEQREVTINNGVFRIAEQSYTVSAAVLEVTASPFYIYLSYPRNGTPETKGTHNINDTISSGETFKFLFYTFTLSEDEGTLAISRIHHIGAVQVGNVWA